MALGNLQVTGGSTITLEAGTYSINSLKLTGGSTIVIGSGPVILNVAGTDDATPIDFEGGATANESFDPSMFRIHYAGTGTLKLTGGTTVAAIVYAPRANAQIAGSADVARCGRPRSQPMAARSFTTPAGSAATSSPPVRR